MPASKTAHKGFNLAAVRQDPVDAGADAELQAVTEQKARSSWHSGQAGMLDGKSGKLQLRVSALKGGSGMS